MHGPKGTPLLVCTCKPSGYPLLVGQRGRMVTVTAPNGTITTHREPELKWDRAINSANITRSRIMGQCPKCRSFFDIRLKSTQEVEAYAQAIGVLPDITVESALAHGHGSLLDFVTPTVKAPEPQDWSINPFNVTLPSANGEQVLTVRTPAQRAFCETALHPKYAGIAAEMDWNIHASPRQFEAWERHIREQGMLRRRKQPATAQV